MPPSGLIPVAEALDNLFALVDPVDPTVRRGFKSA